MSQTLQSIAKTLLEDPKGLLAADESTKSATKRLESVKVRSTAENRRLYRQLLFATPNLNHYISGVILYDETIRQKTDSDQSIPAFLSEKGIIPGIKVDGGLVPLNNFDPETITEGLDGLAERLAEYYKMGARFTKWRSAFEIGTDLPSIGGLHANLHQMGRYATLVQAAGMVPIVEPEVLYAGKHDIKKAAEVTGQVLTVLFQLLKAYKVDLSGTILKTSMVLAGSEATLSKPEEVATYTLQVLNKTVPKELAGIVFLSGGQSPDQATRNLNAIGQSGKQPWPITYSYSRAVQDPVLKLWHGNKQNVKKAQALFAQLVAQNSAARNGEYFG
jgi:fructose-bisphosphate aldolase class I